MWNPDIYLKALNFAAKAHKDQKVPGTEMAYITHVAQVVQETFWSMLNSDKFDIDYAVQCAMLHDTIEDTEITYQNIEFEFGKHVADGVLALTKNEELPKDQQMIDSIKRIKTQPVEIAVIKIADRIANLKPAPSYWTRERMIKYRDEAIYIAAELQGHNKEIDERIQQKIEWYTKLINIVFQ